MHISLSRHISIRSVRREDDDEGGKMPAGRDGKHILLCNSVIGRPSDQWCPKFSSECDKYQTTPGLARPAHRTDGGRVWPFQADQ